MSASDRQGAYTTLVQELEAMYESRDSAEFLAALDRLRDFASGGSVEAARFLGELLALPGAARDPSEAYKWYYVGLSQSGYSVEFNDQNHDPPYYCGPRGDFRNESMVSDLVVELGFDRVRELDDEAAAWLAGDG